MTRPAHVKCSACCYFEPRRPHPNAHDAYEGFRIRLPPVLLAGPCPESA